MKKLSLSIVSAMLCLQNINYADVRIIFDGHTLSLSGSPKEKFLVTEKEFESLKEGGISSFGFSNIDFSKGLDAFSDFLMSYRGKGIESLKFKKCDCIMRDGVIQRIIEAVRNGVEIKNVEIGPGTFVDSSHFKDYGDIPEPLRPKFEINLKGPEDFDTYNGPVKCVDEEWRSRWEVTAARLLEIANSFETIDLFIKGNCNGKECCFKDLQALNEWIDQHRTRLGK